MAEKEYIPVEEIVKHFGDILNTEYVDYYTAGFKNALYAVISYKTTDVAPVKHGHWECDFERLWKARCSECETEFYICDLEEISGGDLVKYCPNCGCKMDEGDDTE